jgi:hypothetical protein
MDQENKSAENGQPPASSTIGSSAPAPERKVTWDPKGRRNMFIVSGVIGTAVVLVLLMSFLGGGRKEDGKVSSITPSKNDQPVGSGMLSTTEKAALQAEEQARLDHARAEGQSAVGNQVAQSAVTLAPAQGTGHPNASVAGAAGQQLQHQGETRLDQRDGQATATDAAKASDTKTQALASQMETMMQAWGLKSEGSSASAKTLSRYMRSSGQQGAGVGGQQAAVGNGATLAQGARDPNEQPLIGAFEQVYGAETLGPIDTDTPGKLRARILTGPLAGGIAMGVARRIGTQGVQFDFSGVAFKGQLVKVAAYGVDIETSGDVVQGNYDGRYMQRYVFPILSEGVRAYATARAQTGTQVVAINLPGSNGTVAGAQQTPAPTAEQARQAMIAAGANQVSQVLRAGPQDGHITLDVRTQFAIVFEQPVYQSDLTGQAAKTAK